MMEKILGYCTVKGTTRKNKTVLNHNACSAVCVLFIFSSKIMCWYDYFSRIERLVLIWKIGSKPITLCENIIHCHKGGGERFFAAHKSGLQESNLLEQISVHKNH